MKKTLAILLSLVLVVVAVFALALSSAAAEAPKATSVKVTDTDNVAHTLDGTTTSYTAKTGTVSFDAATGVLTLDNASGIRQIYCNTGVLTILVKGENFIEEPATQGNSIDQEWKNDNGVTDLILKGDGSLKVSAYKYGILSRNGGLEFTGDVKVEIFTSASDSIHTPSANGKGVVFSGNAQVNASSNGNVIVHYGKEPVVIKDKAQVSVVMKGTNLVSRNGLFAKQFRMESGSLDVSLEATGLPSNIKANSVYTCRAIFVEGVAGNTNNVEFLGGKVKVNLPGTVNTNTAFSAIYVKNAPALVLKNTEFDFDITFPGKNEDVASVVYLENVPALTVDGCKIDVDAEKPRALFGVVGLTDAAGTEFSADFKNSSLTGRVYCFIATTKGWKNVAVKVNFDKSCTANLALPGKVIHGDCVGFTTVTTNASFLTGADFSSNVALITGSPERKVGTVTITPPQGTNITLSAGKRQLTESDAKYLQVPQDSIVYDPVAGTVTLNNMNGGVNRLWASTTVNYIVKGENTITMKTTLGKHYAFGGAENVVLSGDGTLTVSGGANVMVAKDRFVLEGDVKVKAISNRDTDDDYAIHLLGDGNNEFIVRDNAQLDLLTGVKGFYLAGAQPTLQITDNAKVSISSVEKSFAGQGIHLCPDVDNGTGSQDAVLEVSGNASLKISNAGVGVEFGQVLSEDDTDALVKEKTAVNGIFDILDNAVVEVSASAQALNFALKSDEDTSVLRIEGNSNAKFVSSDPTNESVLGASIEMVSPKNEITMTTTGTVELVANAGADRGALYVHGDDYDIFVKDTTLNVTNISECSVAPNGGLVHGINLDGKGDGKFLVAGNAVINVNVEKNGEKEDNRAYGIFINSDHQMTVQDNAKVNVTVGGDSKAAAGTGIYLKKATLLVKNKAKVTAVAKGTAVAAMTFEAASELVVEGAAGVILKGDGKGIAGVRPYNRSAKGTITVKDGGSGYVEVYGDPAFNVKLKKITTSSSVLKAGEDKKSAEAVKEVKGTEGYVFLGSTNPPTSDLSIALFVTVALVAVAATVTTVILRKKYSR